MNISYCITQLLIRLVSCILVNIVLWNLYALNTPFKLIFYNLTSRITMLVIQDLYWNQSRFFISVLSCCCKMNFIKTFSLMHKIYGLHWSPNFIDHEYIKGKFQFSFLWEKKTCEIIKAAQYGRKTECCIMLYNPSDSNQNFQLQSVIKSM